MKIIYKVVRLNQGSLVSVWATCPELMIEYKLGVKSTAKVGKLFAFSSLEAAKRYVRLTPDDLKRDLTILKCKTYCKLSRGFNAVLGIVWIAGCSNKYARKFWNNPKKSNYIMNPRWKGTVLVKSLTPLEFI